jgi:hypothetical protein
VNPRGMQMAPIVFTGLAVAWSAALAIAVWQLYRPFDPVIHAEPREPVAEPECDVIYLGAARARRAAERRTAL